MTEPPGLDPAESVQLAPIGEATQETLLEVVTKTATTEAHKVVINEEKKNSKKTEKIMLFLSVGLIVELILVFVVIATLTKIQDNDVQLNRVQQVTNTQILCPLYVRLKANEGTTLKTQYPNPSDYNSIVQQIQRAIDLLGCTNS